MRNQGVQTIETGALYFARLPPITEPLKTKEQQSVARVKQAKFQLKPLEIKNQKPPTTKRQLNKIVLKQLNLPLVQPEIIVPSKSRMENASTLRLEKLENYQLLSCITRIRNLSYNDSIGRTDRSPAISIRGTQSQIQSRLLI